MLLSVSDYLSDLIDLDREVAFITSFYEKDLF